MLRPDVPDNDFGAAWLCIVAVALRGGIDAGPLRVCGKQSCLSGSPRENTPEENSRKPPGPFYSGYGGIRIIVRNSWKRPAGDRRLFCGLLICADGLLEAETRFSRLFITAELLPHIVWADLPSRDNRVCMRWSRTCTWLIWTCRQCMSA